MVPLGTTHQPPPPATHPRALAPAMPSMGGRGAASRDLTRNPRTAQPEPPRRRSPPSADQGRGASSRYLMSTHTATCHTCPPGEFLLVRTDIYRDPRPGTSLPPTPPVRPTAHTHSPPPPHVPDCRQDCTPDTCPGRVVWSAWSCVLGCALLDARSATQPAPPARGTRSGPSCARLHAPEVLGILPLVGWSPSRRQAGGVRIRSPRTRGSDSNPTRRSGGQACVDGLRWPARPIPGGGLVVRGSHEAKAVGPR